MSGVRKVVLYSRASAPWARRVGGGVVSAKGGGRGGGMYSVFILKLRYLFCSRGLICCCPEVEGYSLVVDV